MSDYFIKPQPLSAHEVERIRLLLSTFQDGTGQYSGGQEPGWRDFERVVALALGGTASESKSIFDVLIPHRTAEDMFIGVSCKMRGTLDWTQRSGRVVVEVSNASAKFQAAVSAAGYAQEYLQNPSQVGTLIISLVERWIAEATTAKDSQIDVTGSFFLVLSYSKPTRGRTHRSYQLHQFNTTLPDPSKLVWYWPKTEGKDERRLVGSDSTGATVIEWYHTSGGQLKYYPLTSEAIWQSPLFQLEPLPLGNYGLLNKAASYFPELWEQAFSEIE